MLARCFPKDSGPLLGAATLIVVGLALLPAAATAAPPVTREAPGDCNSDLEISLPVTVAAGSTQQVTLAVISGPSTDLGDNPAPQMFQSISYFPSCSSTLPCVVDATLPVSFVGLVSNTCGVMPTATPMGGGTEIEFTFPPNPPALTLPAAGSPAGQTSCQIVFDVMIDAAFLGMISMEAETDGDCGPGINNSSADGTANIDVIPAMPTTGEAGLVALALLLGLASWAALRRQQVGGRA